MSTFITADEHVGHDNMILHMGRPFKDTDHMREELIARHNQKVQSERDLTIHVGDMFWDTVTVEEATEYLSRLNGRHAYILGNHEKVFRQHRDVIAPYFVFIDKAYEFNWNKHHICLSHYAHRVWCDSHKGSWMLYGHSHGELPEEGLSFDIGVDQHNYEPWTLDEIAAKMSGKKCNHVIPADKVWPGKQTPQTYLAEER